MGTADMDHVSRSSNGKDTGLSPRKHGFDSRRGYHDHQDKRNGGNDRAAAEPVTGKPLEPLPTIPCSVNSVARVPACLAGSQGFKSPTGRQYQFAGAVQPVERRVETPSIGGRSPAAARVPMDGCPRGPREPPAKRWPACAGSSVRIAPHPPPIYLVSSADKSIGLRNRGSHVQIVHEVPATGCQRHAPACG